MKNKIAVFYLLFVTGLLNAQDSLNTWKAKQSVFGEVFGVSGIYGVNYERIFFQKKSITMCGRVGFGFLPINLKEDRYFTWIPIGLTCFLGKNKNHFQFGVSELYLNTNEIPFTPPLVVMHQNFFYTLLFLGYRYQRPTGGFYGQANIVPLIIESGRLSYPSAGIAIGYSFERLKVGLGW